MPHSDCKLNEATFDTVAIEDVSLTCSWLSARGPKNLHVAVSTGLALLIVVYLRTSLEIEVRCVLKPLS